MRFWGRQPNAGDADAAAEARRFVESQPSILRVLGIELRANEETRHVFAVFFDDGQPSRPRRYKIIAVPKSGDGTRELEPAECLPYRVRGLK